MSCVKKTKTINFTLLRCTHFFFYSTKRCQNSQDDCDVSCPGRIKEEERAVRHVCPDADNTSWWLNGLCPNVFFLNLKDKLSLSWSRRVSWYFNCRFIARPCAMGLKIQANGPQKAQPNAILEKVFTAITKVVHVSVSSSQNICAATMKASTSYKWIVLYLVLPAPRREEVGGPV